MKPILVTVEKKMTVKQLLASQGLKKPELYFVSLEGKLLQDDSIILDAGQRVRVMPKVAGG